MEFCEAMDRWARLAGNDSRFREAWAFVRLQIAKSCLLDRMLYRGERPSETPCPVHKGRWSGMWSGGRPDEHGKLMVTWVMVGKPGMPEEHHPATPEQQAVYDAGCRCFLHGCGCITGWQVEPGAGLPEAAEVGA